MTAKEDSRETVSETTEIQAIKTAYELWANESVVKTEKLTLFFIAQSVLVTGFALGVPKGQVLIALIGIASSYLSFVSIGRTDAFQNVWQNRVEERLDDASEPVTEQFDLYPEPEDISEMKWYKQISQEYIHYPPLIGLLVWLSLLIIVVFTRFA